MIEATQINASEELQAWLEGKPPEWNVAIVTKTATIAAPAFSLLAGAGHDNKGLHYNLSSDDGRTWKSDLTVILLPETSIAARYYSARTIQLDDEHVGTVFMNRNGVHFLKVSLDRLSEGTE